ncbi:MAG: Uncharacterised protein [Owenweeksia sp. TMED14]|nr:MAG: Uncharacterised protein [Owenweeksia sp. TMED14]
MTPSYYEKSGAVRLELYQHLFVGKRIGIVAHAPSLSLGKWDDVNNSIIYERKKESLKPIHTVDRCIKNGWNVVRVFSPEHGFRGKASAGEHVANKIDPSTGLPIVSLYGSHKKPSKSDLEDLDIIIFDLQDVGVRFYTYISTLSYVMESCAENGKKIVVLDRPNPFASSVSGPVLDPIFSSFVGLHPVPILYGLTIGEYAKMIKGEGWINEWQNLDLTILSIPNYNRESLGLPIAPSPNLPNYKSIQLYPSLCLFEACPVSIGRGTDLPFQVIGAPWFPESNYSFIPQPNVGADYPKFQNITCFGEDLSEVDASQLGFNLKYVIKFYNKWKESGSDLNNTFFSPFFEKLVGTDRVRHQIVNGMSAIKIKLSWELELESYRHDIRNKYLIYSVKIK